MRIIPRCWRCKRRIWPWQRIGWLVGDKVTVYWHGEECHGRR